MHDPDDHHVVPDRLRRPVLDAALAGAREVLAREHIVLTRLALCELLDTALADVVDGYDWDRPEQRQN